jgi:hypothetical protein
MDGYLGDDRGYQPADKAALRNWWRAVIIALVSMVPLFWLWDRTGFPDELGIHIDAHGKAGLPESWFYSYLPARAALAAGRRDLHVHVGDRRWAGPLAGSRLAKGPPREAINPELKLILEF